jgi:hypothetical protein
MYKRKRDTGLSSFLGGNLTKRTRTKTSYVGPISSPNASNKLAAKSSTTLECWQECTVNISGC